MAKDPAFLFYTGDFATGTQFFTNEQVGIYIRLLMAQHQHGRLSEKQVKFICPNFDIEIISKFKKDEFELFYNERLENEIYKRKSFSESRSNNKKGKTKDTKNISKSLDFTSDIHMDNKDENEDKDIELLIQDTVAKEFLKTEIRDGVWWLPVRNETKPYVQGDEHLEKLLDEFCELKQFEPYNSSKHRKCSFVLFVKNKFEDNKKNNGTGTQQISSFERLQQISDDAGKILQQDVAVIDPDGEGSGPKWNVPNR